MAALKTGISTKPSEYLTILLMPAILPAVAPFVPSIGSSACLRSFTFEPRRLFQLFSRILFHMDISERMAGIQQAAERSIPMPKVSLCGAGMTYMLLVEPSRIGERGPASTEQVRPHDAFSKGKSCGESLGGIGFPESSLAQSEVLIR